MHVLAVAFVMLLVFLGWNQSFETHWYHMTGRPVTTRAKATLRTAPGSGAYPYNPSAAPYNPYAPVAPAAPAPDRSWIFGRTILDPPRK